MTFDQCSFFIDSVSGTGAKDYGEAGDAMLKGTDTILQNMHELTKLITIYNEALGKNVFTNPLIGLERHRAYDAIAKQLTIMASDIENDVTKVVETFIFQMNEEGGMRDLIAKQWLNPCKNELRRENDRERGCSFRDEK